jgi:hypothetical protein
LGRLKDGCNNTRSAAAGRERPAEVYNGKVKAASAWIETSVVPVSASNAILIHLHKEPIPANWTATVAKIARVWPDGIRRSQLKKQLRM